MFREGLLVKDASRGVPSREAFRPSAPGQAFYDSHIPYILSAVEYENKADTTTRALGVRDRGGVSDLCVDASAAHSIIGAFATISSLSVFFFLKIFGVQHPLMPLHLEAANA